MRLKDLTAVFVVMVLKLGHADACGGEQAHATRHLLQQEAASATPCWMAPGPLNNTCTNGEHSGKRLMCAYAMSGQPGMLAPPVFGVKLPNATACISDKGCPLGQFCACPLLLGADAWACSSIEFLVQSVFKPSVTGKCHAVAPVECSLPQEPPSDDDDDATQLPAPSK